MSDKLLADLTEEQRDAVTTRASPLCIVAGAGSGKTRVLTRRIAWQSEQGYLDPRRSLAITFTRRAAGELRERLRALGLRDSVAAGTFHAVALAQLRRHWEQRGQRPRDILESRAGFLARQFAELDRPGVVELAAEIGWARARLVTPESYADVATAAGRRPSIGTNRAAAFYADYEQAKRHRRLIDFDDVLTLCHATISRDTEFGAAQRWRHRHLSVDEFQDVNPLQFALLRAWIGEDSTLFVVGDPDQAIYGWNGADPDFIRRVDTHLPGCAVVHLRTNFRSTPEILDAAGRLMDRDPQPAVRPPGPAPTITELDGADEASGIARAVRGRHVPGRPWRRQAVLARTNAQLTPIRQALERAGIPTRLRGDTDLLDRHEVIHLLAEWPSHTSLATVVADTRFGDVDNDEASVALDAFLLAATDHLDLDSGATIASFTTALRAGDRADPTSSGVELATFHSSKGLQWPVVHLIGIERGLVPIAHARSAAARAEERRLLYVAMTRAEQELHLYWCSTRTRGESQLAREPSPWLDLVAAPASEPVVEDSVTRLATARARITTSATDAHGPLRAALGHWRERVARQARVDPVAICSDTVLDDLAARRPRAVIDLREVEGLAPGHARRWGDDLVAIVAAHTEG